MLHRGWFDWTLAMDAVADTRCAELWLGGQARATAPAVPTLELTPAARACSAFAAYSLLGKRKKEADEDASTQN
jgi:hypothetical protein